MYVIKKIVGFLLDPCNVAMVTGLVAFALLLARHYRRAIALFGLTILWVFIWGNSLVLGPIRAHLEKLYPPVAVKDVPTADAIVLLGGGMTSSSRWDGYPDMASGADRVWHAARLWKAGKAPIIIPTGVGVEKAEWVLLQDLGVPASAIITENRARNTHENACYVAQFLAEKGISTNILLVTSAAHMRRSMLCYEQAGLAPIPCATDYDYSPDHKFKFIHLLPSAGGMAANNETWHEILGYWGQRLLKR